jgi:hypothetical protein
MTMNEERTPDPSDLPEGSAAENEDRERSSMDADLDPPEDPLLSREERAAAREAAGIGGPRPDYEDEEDLRASEAQRPLYESGEGVEEGFEIAEDDLEEAASHEENRYVPEAHDFGDEESAGDADALSGEPDEIDVTETTRDPNAGTDDDPGEGPGISHDR